MDSFSNSYSLRNRRGRTFYKNLIHDFFHPFFVKFSISVWSLLIDEIPQPNSKTFIFGKIIKSYKDLKSDFVFSKIDSVLKMK